MPSPTTNRRFPVLRPPATSRPGSISARKTAGPRPNGRRRGVIRADEGAVVVTVSVVPAGPPLGVTAEGLNEQLASAGRPLQLAALKLIVWLNPFSGVIVTVVVPLWPGALMVTVVGLALIVKSGAAATFSVCAGAVEPEKFVSPL